MKKAIKNKGKRPPVWVLAVVIAITLATVAVVVFLSSQTYVETRKMAIEQFNQQQLILAHSAAAGIEYFVADIGDDMLALSSFPVVQRMEPGILEQMEILYKGIPPQTSSRRLDKNGILRFIYPNEGWRKDLISQDYSHATCFQRAKETGEIVISGLIINEAGERRIQVVRPVYVEDKKGAGVFNGVVIGSFDPKALSKLYISPIVSGQSGYAWLLDEHGIFLVHHEAEFVGQNAFKVRAETNSKLSYDLINNIQRQMMAGEEGVSHYVSGWHRGDKGEVEKLVAYIPVHVLDKTWSVAVCAPVDEVERITSKAYRNELYTLGFIILILTAAGVFFFIVFSRWTRSLQQEIETRKQVEEHITHLAAVLRGVRNVNQLITREKDRGRLLQGACDRLIETPGYHSAWIALLDESRGLVATAEAGLGEGFLPLVERLKRGELIDCGQRALSQSGVVVTKDTLSNCRDCPLSSTYGGRGAMSVRLESDENVYGLLSVSIPGSAVADAEEQALFAELAGDISFALHSIQQEQERKRAKERLRESDKRIRNLMESLPVGVSISTVEGAVTEVNPVMWKIFGYRSEKEFLKVPSHLLYHDPKDRGRFLELLKKDAVKDFEARFKRKDGTIFWGSITSTTQTTQAGTTEVIKVFEDITERKQAKGQEKKLEAQLRQAQKMEAIGTLAGGIAHDFNNILSAVIGYTELALINIPKESSLQNDLQQVLKAGSRAKDLVRQILAFSRQAEQEIGPVQIKLIVKEALKLLRASLPTTIEILQDIQSNSMVLADPTQVHQVLMNLCTNAGYAMQETGGTLEVSLTNVELDSHFTGRYPDMAPGPHLRLTVSDTGHGMTPDVLDRIFDPFFTTKGPGEGTGMGLSVVHGIVKSFGGTITVYSEPGKGSTFHVYLPIADDLKDEGETEEIEPLPTGNERILFIDDEQPLVEIGNKILARLGYEVITRTSSIEALELFRAQPDRFDLVITDMTMPNMTGVELAKKLMQMRHDIPIILCTGFSKVITEDKANAMGIRELVMKPFVIRDMASTIRKVLDSA
jgi:PAS domain S-box-containing protein